MKRFVKIIAVIAMVHLIFDVAKCGVESYSQKIRIENPISNMEDLDYGIGLYKDSITIKDQYGLDTTVHYQTNLSELFLDLNL